MGPRDYSNKKASFTNWGGGVKQKKSGVKKHNFGGGVNETNALAIFGIQKRCFNIAELKKFNFLNYLHILIKIDFISVWSFISSI